MHLSTCGRDCTGEPMCTETADRVSGRPTPETEEQVFHRNLLRARHVEDPCLRCHGYGVRAYSSTATWRGGMGGCALSSDVCDSCWGSGDRFRSGVDLRRLRDEEHARAAKEAVDLLARSVGASYDSTRGAIVQIILVLEKLADKRGTPAAPHLPELARGLAKLLREASTRYL